MKRLRELRLEKGLTQQQLAESLHVSQQSVHKYESGICSPTADGLKDIARFFQTSVDYLVELSDLRYPEKHPEYMSLSDAEKRVLGYYRLLEPITQELIQRIIYEKNKNL